MGVYVDGFNLYYGARSVGGRGAPGWRWLDIRALAEAVITLQGSWSGAQLERVVYCTARIDGRTNPSGSADQATYLLALERGPSVDWIEYGNYVARAKRALLATEDPTMRRPVPVTSTWPVMVRDQSGAAVPNAQFLVSYLHLEEKGSDVNVATHLLDDVLSRRIDAAVVISNDSDLSLPLRLVRRHVPLATVNPQQGQTAGALRGNQTDGVGGHWWWKIQSTTYLACQLTDPYHGQRKPSGW